MSKLMLFIFLVSFGGVQAMEEVHDLSTIKQIIMKDLKALSGIQKIIVLSSVLQECSLSLEAVERKKEENKRLVVIVNGTQKGIVAQIDTSDGSLKGAEQKVWVPGTANRRMQITPPQPPAITHLLRIKDHEETNVFATMCFHHPENNIIFSVLQDNEGTFAVKKSEDLEGRVPNHF